MKKRVMWRGVVSVSLVAGAVAVAGTSPASAARSDAAQVINLNTELEGSEVADMITVGSKIFFVADDNVHGDELFVTDGTLAGTKLVKDIYPGVDGPRPEYFADVNGTLYFQANDGVHGAELWKSDGTAAGTVMVKDINLGATGSFPTGLVNLNGTVLFTANNGTNGLELCKSDGNAEGTVMVQDIAPSYTEEYQLSIYTDIVVLGSTAYFGADNGVNGVELWKSDGTDAGTMMVQDLNLSGSSNVDPKVAGGYVWFRWNDPVTQDPILSRYDGTTITEVKNFGDGDPNQYDDSAVDDKFFVDLGGGKVLFVAYDRPAKAGWELWVTDGTSNGTTMVKDINASGDYQGSDPSEPVILNGKAYFTADDGVNGRSLWVTDGLSTGTTLVKDIMPSNTRDPGIAHLTVVGSTIFFRANDNANSYYDAPTPRGTLDGPGAQGALIGEELWKSDGTTNGTVPVKDINPETDDDRPEGSEIDTGGGPFASISGSVYFFATDGSSEQLWRSDGTEANTKKFADISERDLDSRPGFAGMLGSKALFFADDGGVNDGLYITDGTAGGTTRLGDAFGDPGAVVIGPKAYFGGYDDTTGFGLFETDGTLTGTKLVKDMNPSSMEATLWHMTAVGSKLFFVSDDGTHSTELWVSDGTSVGTKMVKDINPGSDYPGIDGLAVLGSKVYFNANDGTNGNELWVSDGTAEGTQMLKDIDPGVNGPSEAPCYGVCWGSPRNLATVGSYVYFSAYGPDTGVELWKTDGTEAGTVLVKDIWTGVDSCGCPINYAESSYPSKAYELSGKAYFTANDGSGGAQLWTSDGTAAGTVLVENINPTGSSFNYMLKANDRLVFWVNDGTHGNEMWATDGTAAGTALVKDINPGDGSVNPDGYAVTPTGLYVSLWDGTARSIWFTDGTEAGTTKVVTIQNNARGGMQPYRGGLLYVNDNGTDGEELWSYGLPVGTAQTISFSPPANMKANEVVALTGTATSGLPVTYLATGQCEIKTSGRDAGKLKLKGAGTCSVRAMQAGNEEWAPADDVLMTIAIARNNVVVKFLGVVKALSPTSFGVLSNASGRVQLKAQVTPALEGCEVRFDVSPNNATPAGPYTATSDEDGIILSEPIVIGQGTYDFTVTPLGDCEGTPVDAPEVYLGELPPTGANTTVLVWIGAALLAAGVLLVGRRRRTV